MMVLQSRYLLAAVLSADTGLSVIQVFYWMQLLVLYVCPLFSI